MGDMAWDPQQTGSVPAAFETGKGLQNLPGSVAPRKHKLHRSNIEQEANDAQMEKRMAGIVEKFPMHTHKAGGLVRVVNTEDQLADALAKGWKADIREVDEAPKAAPTKISEMTLAQAKDFVAAHKDDGAKIAEILADEQAHGNRAKVVAVIMAAADALGAPKAGSKPKAGAAKRKK